MKLAQTCVLERSALSSRDAPAQIVILSHHKCATTFISTYLRRLSDLNDLSMYTSHSGAAMPQPGCDISLLTNATYGRVAGTVPNRAVHIIRNPLDIVVSAYYSHRATHPDDDWPHLRQQRSVLLTCSKEAGLFLTLSFLERDEFYTETPGPLSALRTWDFDDHQFRTIRMEDVVPNVNSAFGEILSEEVGGRIMLPDSDDFTFERISGGRRIGEVDDLSHYRCGRAGQWRRELPPPIIAYVRGHFRNLLERYYPEALDEPV